MIKPTVGRIVWYRPSAADLKGGNEKPMFLIGNDPLSAQIVGVLGERLVNLIVFDAEGWGYPRTQVILLKGDDQDMPVKVGDAYAEWMPYQIGQAKRHETRLEDSITGIIANASNVISTTAAASLSHRDYQVEVAIQSAGLNAPRVRPEDIHALIKDATYMVTPSGRTTICELTLTNGFTVRGEASVVSLENFDPEIGKNEARQKAIDKIWELEGYLLRQRMFDAENAAPAKMSAEDEVAKIDRIARVCHEVNRAYCEAMGDHSQPSWEAAPAWQRESARMGVDLHLSGDFGPEASHISWMNQKLNEGWKYGPVKDPEKKEHPCMVPFDSLPTNQQAKDYLFRSVVHALR